MGSSVCAALSENGHEVLWVGQGRGDETRARAARYVEVADMQALPESADAVVSVCPPHAAEALSRAVSEVGFTGWYLDANAVSPARSANIARTWGDRYIDGGIVGPPAWHEGTTRIFLSGRAADVAENWFAGSLLQPILLSGDVTDASALKMCYAAFTKGSSAMLLAVRVLAEQLGVAEPLLEEWQRSQPGLGERAEASAKAVAPKAWRFEGEMREIAQTFASVGLPDGFHQAAGDFYAALEGLKDDSNADLKAVLDIFRAGTRNEAPRSS